jgi:type VI secretion system secreted protein Hcp
MFAVILAMVTAWMVVTDRAGAASAPAPTVAQAEDVLNAVLALQENGSDDGGRIFAKYDGVDGESSDENHAEWINIDSYEWGAHVSAATTTASRRRGAAEIDGFVLNFDYEKASPKLEEKLLKGEIIPKLEIELTSSYGETRATYLRYEMTNVRITDFQVVGEEGMGLPYVSFANNFEEIKVTYSEYDDEGTLKGNVEYSYKVE